MDMGFSKSNVEKALSVTGNKGVEAAMEWLLAHPDLSFESSSATPAEVTDDSAATAESAGTAATTVDEEVAAAAAAEADAKSIKCDVCGKLFKTSLEVEFHATKSGHDQFSESTEEKKALSEEERKQQLQILEDKLRQKRKEREEKDEQEALAKEKDRIRSGKEMATAKKKLEELEMKKILDQRKREKEEDRLARERVRKQIEADKAARRAKNGTEAQSPPPAAPVVAAPPVSAAAPKKEYNETKLQIRLTNGQLMTQTFCCKEQLSAVRLYVELNRTDGAEPFTLMTNFPKKVFSDSDFDAPLEALGLVPTAVIIVQKRKIDI